MVCWVLYCTLQIDERYVKDLNLLKERLKEKKGKKEVVEYEACYMWTSSYPRMRASARLHV